MNQVLFPNCTLLLLQWTWNYLFTKVNGSITVHFDSVLDPPSHNSQQPQNTFNDFNYILLSTKYDPFFYNLNQVLIFLHIAGNVGVYTVGRGQNWCHVIWCGASNISIKKVSMGVSPMSLKKNRCSRHLRPIERRAGRRSSNLANLPKWKEENQKHCWHYLPSIQYRVTAT